MQISLHLVPPPKHQIGLALQAPQLESKRWINIKERVKMTTVCIFDIGVIVDHKY